MNADAFRHFFGYHFNENRNLWDAIMTLTDEQFGQEAGYSRGSVRNQVVHLMNVDRVWFSELQAIEVKNLPKPEDFADREEMRAYWDGIEQDMRAYLDALRDDMLTDKPIVEEDDSNLIVWQVLLHVVNHATDHRAQILRLLNDLGVETVSQDYIFYVYDHP